MSLENYSTSEEHMETTIVNLFLEPSLNFIRYIPCIPPPPPTMPLGWLCTANPECHTGAKYCELVMKGDALQPHTQTSHDRVDTFTVDSPCRVHFALSIVYHGAKGKALSSLFFLAPECGSLWVAQRKRHLLCNSSAEKRRWGVFEVLSKRVQRVWGNGEGEWQSELGNCCFKVSEVKSYSTVVLHLRLENNLPLVI